MIFELQYTDTKSTLPCRSDNNRSRADTKHLSSCLWEHWVRLKEHITELKEDIQAQIILGNTYHLYLRRDWTLLKGRRTASLQWF